jgi:hypothetical protein
LIGTFEFMALQCYFQQVEQKARQEDEQRRAEEAAKLKAEADAAEAALVQAALNKGASP